MQSLSGDAESGVAVEAVGQGECSIYSEDTVTDDDGHFRLRGLLVSGTLRRMSEAKPPFHRLSYLRERRRRAQQLAGSLVT